MSAGPKCRCGKAMTPSNANIAPELFLCDECCMKENIPATKSKRETPWEIAEKWYRVDEIAIGLSKAGSSEFGALPTLPKDVNSVQFATWLTHQYRLAMAKGIQLGRSEY